MMSGWTLFLTALGVAMFLEGLPYLASPSAVRRFFGFVVRRQDTTLRIVGLVLMSAGLLVAYLATH